MEPSIEGQSNTGESRLAKLLAAAGDPTRVRILALLRDRPLSVAEICAELEAAQPRVSHHLGILRRNDLLEVEVRGRQRYYHWPRQDREGAASELRVWLDRWLGESRDPSSAEPSPATPSSPGDELEDFLL